MSKSQPVTQSTTSSTDIPAWLTQLSQQAGNAGANLPQYSPYTGANGQAGLTPQQIQAMGLSSSNVGQGQGVAASGANALSGLTNFSAGNVNAGTLNPDISALMNPYIQNVIGASNAQTDKATAGAMNAADNSLAAQHAFGNSRQGVADADVQNQGAMTKSSTAANLLSSGYNTASQEALSAQQGNQNAAIGSAGVNLGAANGLTGLGTALSGMNAQDLQGLLNAGNVAQTTNTNQNMFNYQQYLNSMQIPDQQASTFASILGSLPHNTSSQGTTTGNTYTNGALGAAGLGLGIAGLGTGGGATLGGSALSGLGTLAPLLLSDRRAKRDIEVVGKMFDGTPVYRFRYLNSDTMQIGLMADEVDPAAVHDTGLFKMVDYERATERAAQMGA